MGGERVRGVVLTREAVCVPARCTGGRVSCLYVCEREALDRDGSSGGESSQSRASA